MLVKSMICGLVKFCGILTLESGYGNRTYSHVVPTVHGLWPETGQYGTSSCVYPAGNPSEEITNMYCYTDKNFQKHEWISHGICAASNSNDYFLQVCNLSKDPLFIMSKMKAQNKSIDEMSIKLGESGYEVFAIDNINKQIQLSVCASDDKLWKFSPVKQFMSNCS